MSVKKGEVNARTRIFCPLCGSCAWQSQFEKKKPLLKALMQFSPAFRKFQYSEIRDKDFLRRLHSFLVEKIEELYEKLTGINIPRLLEGRVGGDEERLRSNTVLISNVKPTYFLKTAQTLSKGSPSVTPTLNLRRTSTRFMTK